MNGERWFFDTNILVYLFDRSAPDKQATAGALWSRACREATPVISTQVLQEFFVTVTRSAKQAMPASAARRMIGNFAELAHVEVITLPIIKAATRRFEESRFSFWDSLIIETAIDTGAQRLWTEDLQHGQTLGPLKIVNPFAPA